MLVLTRNVDESLVMFLPTGETVELKVFRLSKQGARIGIKAPPKIKIVRSELLNGVGKPATDGVSFNGGAVSHG
jgi:carbon storage regulator CsrA